jgi:cystathionine beta-lyase
VSTPPETSPERSFYYELSDQQLRRRGSAKWATFDADVLPAFVAEMDFRTAPAVQDALASAVERELYGYTAARSSDGAAAALADWLRARAGWEVSPKRVHVLPDVLKGMELALAALSPAATPVIVPTPSYPPFFEVVRASGRELVEVPTLVSDGRHELDLESIDRALAAGARTVILCNPHNPLGRAFARDELAALAEVVEGHGGRVIADEVHAPLTYSDAVWTPYATVSEAAAAHSAGLMSCSKGWNIPGLKCAQIVLNTEADEEAWSRLSRLLTHGASVIGILANEAAYRRGDAWLRDTVAYLEGNRALLLELLERHLPGVVSTRPEGTYLAWLDCRRLGLDSPQEFFLEKARVALNDGAGFGDVGRGCVRLNFATSRSRLEEIVERMGRAVSAASAPARA